MRLNSAFSFYAPVAFAVVSLVCAATPSGVAAPKQKQAATSAKADSADSSAETPITVRAAGKDTGAKADKDSSVTANKPAGAKTDKDTSVNADKDAGATADKDTSATASKADRGSSKTDDNNASAKATEADSATQSQSERSNVAVATATESPLPTRTKEEIQNEALSHWQRSQKYFSQWDWKMCGLELELAIMVLPSMQIAHRDLCVLTFLELNWFRSVAEFMMTVGLGDPVPLSPEETNKLTQFAMVKHYNKGMEFARKQDWANTIQELTYAAAVQRSLAFAYASSGDFQTAEVCYKKTFELAPTDGSSHADFAYFLADRGKLGEAQKQMEEAVKSSPNSAALHVDLCWMAESKGDLPAAAKELRLAVNLSPKHAGLWSHLGRILEQTGDKKQATEAYLKALWLDPKQEDAREHLARLQSAQS